MLSGDRRAEFSVLSVDVASTLNVGGNAYHTIHVTVFRLIRRHTAAVDSLVVLTQGACPLHVVSVTYGLDIDIDEEMPALIDALSEVL